MTITLSNDMILLIAACALLAVGLALLLPGGRSWWKMPLGLICATGSLGLFAARFHLLDNWVSDAMFYSLAAVTLVSAVGAVTMRSPVYCAIWFALTLLGTAGLFFFQGAQFLGVATIVVYAGAILVTFLFVLMLCNPEGQSIYDRISWEAGISAATGAILVGLLTWTTTSTLFLDGTAKTAVALTAEGPAPVALTAAPEEQAANILSPRHVEKLGAELFSTHLIAVETAGTLLMVALVGAIAIVAHGRTATARVIEMDPSIETPPFGAGGRRA